MPGKRFLPDGWQRKDYPLSPELIALLKEEAQRQGVSEAALVRKLLQSGLQIEAMKDEIYLEAWRRLKEQQEF
jgi:hypothetical protein